MNAVALVPLFWLMASPAPALQPRGASQWTIYITNDNCPDYTWGFTEEQTRFAFAELVRAHLDEMRRTDSQPAENQDRYNMAVTQEALCFLERYPERKAELLRRIQEGRLYVSPFLNNSLWAFQSVESAVRTLYPARRLGLSVEIAEHIELPSLPWGVASILAGCGVRWLSVPFYQYDSTFKGLSNPPLFLLEGPDGAGLRVVMDPWASQKALYAQGAWLLRDPKRIVNEWLPHYQQLGEAYPLSATLASGTHGDISPKSAGQARGFAQTIINYNAQPGDHPKLVNATLPQFCRAVEEAEARGPFLTKLRGCFGHSWDLWPVSLAKYAAEMRTGERAWLAAEALLAVAAAKQPGLAQATRARRERAEWCWTMLADHAWNGTNLTNQRHNAELRRNWSEELLRLGQVLEREAWSGLGLQESSGGLSLFNPLSVPRADLVRLEAPVGLPGQQVVEDGRRLLYFVSPTIAGFGFAALPLKKPAGRTRARLRATPTELESPYYRLRVDPATGGLSSLIHKATGSELVVGPAGRTLAQTVYFDGEEHTLAGVTSEVAALGEVLARLKIRGAAAGISVTSLVTVYSDLDRVDFDLRINKPPITRQERLCHLFPLLRASAVERIETTGAVIRPRLQPEGDLLEGADTRRFAVQGFVDVSLPDGPGVTIAPLDAFVLRRDLEPLTFEALGNDQNYREVTRDQDGVREFRFRYALRVHAGPYAGAEAFAWSRCVASPLLAVRGRLPLREQALPEIAVDPARAIATCLKPAEEQGRILRLWETAGRSGPLSIRVHGCQRAMRTNLLEQDREELPISRGTISLDLQPHGLEAVRLLP